MNVYESLLKLLVIAHQFLPDAASEVCPVPIFLRLEAVASCNCFFLLEVYGIFHQTSSQIQHFHTLQQVPLETERYPAKINPFCTIT